MVFIFDSLVVFVVLSDTVLALLVDFVQDLLVAVESFLSLVDLFLVSARRLMVQIVMVHPVVVLEEPLSRQGALIDALMLTVLVEIMVVVVPVLIMLFHAQVDDMDRLVVHEDVDVEDDVVQLEQIVSAQV